MTAMFGLIASCLLGAIIIEAADCVRMRRLMDQRVAALNLDRAEHSAEQSTSDNRKQNNIHRGFSPDQYQ
jgi:hypothetical protein